ncbi:hypothetical protein Dcae01_02263 [Deinococcus caeni]|uniref:SDR family oxidoreductase n=2 Tax=Deinococcus caeni TaxID=569127 RepID=A0ABP9UDA1_9DEIO
MLGSMTQPPALPALNMRTSTALITGASSGIGESLARQLAAHGAHLILVARTEDRLHALAAELGARYRVQVHVLPADLNRPGAAAELHAAVQARGLNVDILVNNAGLGGYGEFSAQPPAEIDRMIAVNIGALTGLTRAFLPDMLARGRGRVLNVASTAAFQPGPLMAVYYATKAYVLSFSEAVAEEVAGSGVFVTALCPGPVQTGFQAVIRIPFISPTIRNFTGLPAPRPEPVSLLLASARIERALQPIQSESVSVAWARATC